MKNSTDRRFFLPTLFFAFFVAFSSSVWAETSQAAEVELQAGFSAIWENGIDSGFRKGARNLGVALGPGLGLEILGSKKSHHLALAFGHCGWILSNLLAEGKWYQGNFEVRGNLFAGGQVSSPWKIRGWWFGRPAIQFYHQQSLGTVCGRCRGTLGYRHP